MLSSAGRSASNCRYSSNTSFLPFLIRCRIECVEHLRVYREVLPKWDNGQSLKVSREFKNARQKAHTAFNSRSFTIGNSVLYKLLLSSQDI